MAVTEAYPQLDVRLADGLPRMEPISFAGCFGWFHGADGDVGVVLCPGVGLDARVAHRFYLELANRLAASGYPTLRFDYLGTGDALEPTDHNPVLAWRRSVQEAVSWLQLTTGKSRIVLCGMRLGAMLAAMAAQDCKEVEALILLAPVISGKSYARELTFISRVHGDLPREKEPDWLETDDLRLPDEAVETLKTLDLRKLQKLAPRVLTVAHSSTSEGEALTLHLQAAGVITSSMTFHNYLDLVQTSGEAETPEQDIQQITSWLQENAPLKIYDTSERYLGPSELRTSDWIETPLWFGPENGLFGVLCQPVESVSTNKAVMVIVNTGTEPHHGLGRFSVLLARNLAESGVASFRIDFRGLGDSTCIPGQKRNSAYETPRSQDISAAIDRMQTQGFSRFGALGVCSGAYHALHAALCETRISYLVSINQAFFLWRTGDSLANYLKSSPKGSYYYFARLKEADTWLRFLKRQSDVSSILRSVFRRLIRPFVTFTKPLLGRCSWFGHNGFPRQAVGTLSRRGVQSLFLLSAKDGTFSALEDHFGAKGRGLSAFQHTRVQTILSSDHTLSRRAMRKEASNLIIKHLRDCRSGSWFR